ncbi:sodium:proton antiporter NhaD [Persicobacter psychrovividus]|uniref:Sodium:proton antiporter n=1 Tax=Persicobacter psychrovividus TaxID=387638 RepID=A0ABM7VBH2_9BACT|nr:sodium:proton antiporter [Persicobacter psychrovividus]
MTAFYLMVVVFVIGYILIATEHSNGLDKAATALVMAMVMWTLYVVFGKEIIGLNFSSEFEHFQHLPHHGGLINFIAHNSLMEHLSEVCEILVFLIGAMSIVEVVDRYQGFEIITDAIETTKPFVLAWIIFFLSFFLSALLDNLTTTIVMIALIRKFTKHQETKWLLAAIVVVAANAGGAFSPIGDVTTIMLWIGGQITAAKIITGIFLPSFVSSIIPTVGISYMLKKMPPMVAELQHDKVEIPQSIKLTMLICGVAALVFVPIFKTLTGLPPFMGMLLGLGILWIISDQIRKKHPEDHAFNAHMKVSDLVKTIDIPTILFFLGILLAVASLQSAGHLEVLAKWMQSKDLSVPVMDGAIGVLSSIVDNVPLVAAAMGMYHISAAGATGELAHFVQDGQFWELLAYCAGTGGSILIIGSAAGVAAMGMEKIPFGWYMKKISLWVLIGYFAGMGLYLVGL